MGHNVTLCWHLFHLFGQELNTEFDCWLSNICFTIFQTTTLSEMSFHKLPLTLINLATGLIWSLNINFHSFVVGNKHRVLCSVINAARQHIYLFTLDVMKKWVSYEGCVSVSRLAGHLHMHICFLSKILCNNGDVSFHNFKDNSKSHIWTGKKNNDLLITSILKLIILLTL